MKGTLPVPGNVRGLWLLRVVLVAVFAGLGLSGAPWWALVGPSVLAGFCFASARRSFVQIFLIAAIVWAAMAIYQDMQSGGRLSQRISAVFRVPIPLFAYVVTAVLPGITAGLAGWFGQSVRRSFCLDSASKPGD